MAPNHKSMQEWHLPTLCTGLTGMSTMIQLAVVLGYDEIYLLGCDLGYGRGNATSRKITR